MNKSQMIVLTIFCFILGMVLIGAAFAEGSNPSGNYEWSDFFGDIRLYLGIVSIGVGGFLLAGKVKR